MTRGDELQNAAGKRVQGQGLRAMKEKGEKLTRLAAIPIEDVCVPCYRLLQQKKRSLSYVPLREPAKCVACGERRVTGAYLAYCPGCARERRICAKCGDSHGARRPATKEQSELRTLEAKLAQGDLKERERRTVLRHIERLKEKRRADAAAQVSLAARPGPWP
jgi:hypothetical protein